MGTRYEDQPPEHWAGPESLDPTSVWRQFLVFGILAFSALGIIAVVSYLALAPMFVTPPAVVPGGRLVLSRDDFPEVGGTAFRMAEPLLREQDAIWLVHLGDEDFVAVAAWWSSNGRERCPVIRAGEQTTMGRSGQVDTFWRAGGECASVGATFGRYGEPLGAPRGLDRYLVSVEGDRVIVNLSREIRGYGATPQPLVSPLATPVQTRRP